MPLPERKGTPKERENFIKNYPKKPYYKHKGSRMTDAEYQSIANDEDAERIANSYGQQYGGLFDFTDRIKNSGYSYGTKWPFYPEVAQEELVRLMNLNNDLSGYHKYQPVNMRGHYGGWDGTDGEINARMAAAAYPKDAGFYLRLADMMNDAEFQKVQPAQGVLENAAKKGMNSNQFYASPAFKEMVYQAEMEPVYQSLAQREANNYADQLDAAYAQMQEMSPLEKAKAYASKYLNDDTEIWG